MWLSLIWTKVKSALSRAAAWPMREDASTPRFMVQTTAAPAQAMQWRNPRRSMPSEGAAWELDGVMRWAPGSAGARPARRGGHPPRSRTGMGAKLFHGSLVFDRDDRRAGEDSAHDPD